MGSLLEQIKQEYVTRYGHKKWTDHLKSIDEVWSGIRRMIAALDYPFAERKRTSSRMSPLEGAGIISSSSNSWNKAPG
ncbi:MAG: hypothetical protein HYU44_18190 [Betaproteobacteria bacterium]|nr:hypothetical protein [Betaproteobacteria bacterium]